MNKDVPGEATCTTCTFAEDFSNYWTAVLYFKARNNTYHRVKQAGNVGFEQAKNGGMTIYYTPYVRHPPPLRTCSQYCGCYLHVLARCRLALRSASRPSSR